MFILKWAGGRKLYMLTCYFLKHFLRFLSDFIIAVKMQMYVVFN